jgi:hypothetical protein
LVAASRGSPASTRPAMSSTYRPAPWAGTSPAAGGSPEWSRGVEALRGPSSWLPWPRGPHGPGPGDRLLDRLPAAYAATRSSWNGMPATSVTSPTRPLSVPDVTHEDRDTYSSARALCSDGQGTDARSSTTQGQLSALCSPITRSPAVPGTRRVPAVDRCADAHWGSSALSAGPRSIACTSSRGSRPCGVPPTRRSGTLPVQEHYQGFWDIAIGDVV